MKKTIINRWALAALTAALTACNADELTRTDQEAALDPNTPVGITATLGAYGNSADSRALASRTGELKAEDLADIVAPGEITSSSPIEPLTDEGNTISGSATFYGYDADLNNDEDKTTGGDDYRGFSLSGTIGALKLHYYDEDNTERGTLYVKDFKRGTNVSKAAYIQISSPGGNLVTDQIFAAADRIVTDGVPAYHFALKHLCAKVSVKLVDAGNNVITADKMQDDGQLCLTHLQSTVNPGYGKDAETTAADITYTISPDQNNPHLYTGQTLTPISDNAGYYNALIHASGYTGTGEAEGTTPTPYTDADKFTVSLKAAENGKPAGNYSLPLSSVKLTNATDGRTTWTYTRPGEHIFVTLTVDQNQVMSATATISDWNTATASAEAGKPGTDDAQIKSIKLNDDGVYEISDASGLQIFADIVNGVNCTTPAATVQMTSGGSFTMPSERNKFANAKLTADIDLSGICHAASNSIDEASWTPIGDYNINYASFNGSFDGQGHVVKNLYINSANLFQGLFGNTYATIKGLTVENAIVSTTSDIAGAIIGQSGSGTLTGCTVTGTTQVNGTGDVGAIIGSMNNGTVSNCHVTGTAAVTTSGNNAGGIIGGMGYGTLTNCSSAATVKGKDYIGGIVGYWGVGDSSSGSTITGCVSTGAVSGKNHVGGLIGYVTSADYKMTACYATGAVSGTGYNIGGLIGFNNNVNILGCYYSGTLGTSGDKIGALVGYNNGTLVLTNCAAFSNEGTAGSTDGVTVTGIGAGNAAATATGCQTGIDQNSYSTIYGIVDAIKQADGSSYWKSAIDGTGGSLKLYWEE